MAGDSLICMACGNTKKFYRQSQIKGDGFQTELITGGGVYIKQTEEYWDEVEDMGVIDYECHKCGSDDVREELSEIERLKIQVRHTNKQGKWYRDGLLEKSWHPNLIRKLGAMSI